MLRLSLASDAGDEEMRLKGREDIKIADLLEIEMGMAVEFTTCTLLCFWYTLGTL